MTQEHFDNNTLTSENSRNHPVNEAHEHDDTAQKNSKSRLGGSLKEIIKFAIIAALIVAPIRFFVASPFIVSGSSMFPTFKNGQYLIVEEISYRLHPPKRGDVIVFRYPKDESKYFIKRIIGLPGETIIIRNGSVIIKNDSHPKGVPLSEEYAVDDSSFDLTTKLGENEYFVMGDNRPHSSDSRYWGPVPANDIVGKTYVRLFPIQSIDLYPGKDKEILYPKLQNN